MKFFKLDHSPLGFAEAAGAIEINNKKTKQYAVVFLTAGGFLSISFVRQVEVR